MNTNHKFNYSASIALSVALPLAVLLAGCGGGGGGGGTPPVTGQAASVTSAQVAVVYAAGTGLSASPLPLSAGVAGGAHVSLPLNVQIAKGVVSSFIAKPFTIPHTASATWTEIGSTGIYYYIASSTNTTAQVQLSTDDSTNNAGYLNLTLVSNPNGSYPIVVDVSWNAILNNQTVTGPETLTIPDGTGDDLSAHADLHYSPAGFSVSTIVTETNGQLTETTSVTKGSVALAFTNVTGNLQSGFTANFSSANGVTGTVTVNPDGSGSAQARDSTGTWTLTWDANQNATLTSPTGQITTGTLASLQA